MTSIQSRDSTIEFLREEGLSEDKITHSIVVAELALKISDEIIRDGIKIDKKVVEEGALLHDVGLTKFGERGFEEEMANPTPEHCALGAEIALDAGFPESVTECIGCHELWTGDEAKEVGFPEPVKEDYIPKSWEAKVVAYADMIVFIAVEEGYDLWKDPEAVIKTYYPYINRCFKSATGKGIEKDHPLIKRLDKFNNEMIRYLKPDFIPKPWRVFKKH